VFFTIGGYIGEDGANTVCAWATRDGDETSYGLREIPVSSVKSMDIRTNVEHPCSVADCLILLYNISLGQRTTTPSFQNKFIDRFSKTFFSEGYRISLSLKTDNIINISSFASYFHMRRWNPEYGVLEPLYDEYRALQGNLAVWLRDEHGMDKPSFMADEIPEERMAGATPELARGVAGILADDDDALAFIEGIFMTCCWRDHSKTNKDLKSTRLREAIDVMREDILEVPEGDIVEFYSPESIARLVKIGKSIPEMYYVLEGSNDIIDLFAFDMSAHARSLVRQDKPLKEIFAPDGTAPKPKPKSNKSKAKATPEPKIPCSLWNGTLPEALNPAQDKGWKRAAGSKAHHRGDDGSTGMTADGEMPKRAHGTSGKVRVRQMTPEELEQAQAYMRSSTRGSLD
jgi:hypothetical protein